MKVKSKIFKQLSFVLISAMALSACSVGSQMAYFPQNYVNKGKKVTAEIKTTSFFGMLKEVDNFKILQQLSNKCKRESGGNVSNIVVELSYSVLAPLPIYKNKIKATGTCCCEEESKQSK